MSIRDGNKIKDILKVVGNQVITTKGCKISFPVRYEMVGLASVGSETSFLGVFKIETLDGSYYGIHSCIAKLHSVPDSVETIKVDDVPYYELTYQQGSVVIEDINLLQDNKLIDKVYREFVSRGRVPAFMSYPDVCRIFSTAKEYAGASVGDSYEALAIPFSIIARNPDDYNQYYREITNEVDIEKVKPVYVPASSVNFAASSTLTKITGAYFYDGVVSAINNPTDRTEMLDHVLRY